MKIECGCHCIKCKSTNLESNRIGEIEKDGYFDMHHTCNQCNTHFDHLDGEVFSALGEDYSQISSFISSSIENKTETVELVNA